MNNDAKDKKNEMKAQGIYLNLHKRNLSQRRRNKQTKQNGKIVFIQVE